VQFCERFEALEAYSSDPSDPPPFHYGTHYSCSGYVLYYLMRLEPYSRLALSLQGGRFDKADRLFRSIGGSWKSAAYENLQDVRELIPEFFSNPEFLQNTNNFDFGNTQNDEVVHDVDLPPWAKGDFNKFIRMNRRALESDVVSRNLHKWVDLIFGYKQRGREAIKAQNLFVHLTYEGNVDVELMEDDIQREATIAQIDNFGQTPSRLEKKPWPSKKIEKAVKDKDGMKVVDFSAVNSLAALSPPFCIVGAPKRVYLRPVSWDICRVGVDAKNKSVGDLTIVKDRVCAVGFGSVFLGGVKYMKPNASGVSIHVSVATPRHREVDKVVSLHDGLHLENISSLCVGGNWIITGCVDSTVRVWKANKNVHSRHLSLKATLNGHQGEVNLCCVCVSFNLIVTGGRDGRVIVWDLKRLGFLRCIVDGGEVKSVCINQQTGSISVLVDGEIKCYDVNGVAMFSLEVEGGACVICSTNCPEWQDGVVVVSGHANGDVRLWGVDFESKSWVLMHLIPDKVHTAPITCLKCVGNDTLLIGDASGKLSSAGVLRLDSLTQQELLIILGDGNDNVED